MSPNTAMKAQRLRNDSTFSPVQSSFELSLGKASSDASVVCYWGLLSWHTRFLWILHDRHFVTIAIESLEKKKSIHWTITPPPTLPCLPSARFNLTASVTPNYSTCISYNFFIFCPICLTFSHKFLYTYCFILSIKNSRRFDDSGGPITLTVWIVFPSVAKHMYRSSPLVPLDSCLTAAACLSSAC